MRQLGELWIRGDGDGASIGAGDPVERIPSTAEAIRERVRHGRNGQYRPLSGARGLPTGWWVGTSPELTLDAAIDAVYPLAVVHRRQFDAGTLRVVDLDEVLQRQSGRYETAASLSPAGRQRVRQVLCDDICVRAPVWDGAAPGMEGIPCPEPCSVLVALAREAAIWEQSPPPHADPDPACQFADFETPGNVVRETYLARANLENQ